jgi:thiamine kinase-like enzyme
LKDFSGDIGLILDRFGLQSNQWQWRKLGNGLINATYLVYSLDGEQLVLQGINPGVFKNSRAVLSNTAKVCDFLHQQQKINYPLEVMRQLQIHQQNHIEFSGVFWRLLTFIKGSKTLDKVTDAETARQLGWAFGQFHLAFTDFDSQQLEPVLPGFHDLDSRMTELSSAVADNDHARLASCKTEVDFALGQQALIEEVEQVLARVPLRLTHNDTKLNNVLFSKKTNMPLAIVDLDTCMPGYLLHDFGDMVRSACATEDENSTDSHKMDINLHYLKAIAAGYLSVLADKLSYEERESLVLGIKLMPLMLAIRFLTDHLRGDKYFQTEDNMQNLLRAKNQFNLFKAIVGKQRQISDLFVDNVQD